MAKTRQEFNACISNAMRGKKMSKEERQREFCLNAKLCSGKSSTREEADRLCALPKAPKAAKTPASTPRVPTQALPIQPSQPATVKHAPVDPAHCEVAAFTEVARMYKDLYAYIYPQDADCGHCNNLRSRILEADIPHPIVDIPGDMCSELASSFGVDRYPSVVHLKRGRVKRIHTGNPDVIIKNMMEGR